MPRQRALFGDRHWTKFPWSLLNYGLWEHSIESLSRTGLLLRPVPSSAVCDLLSFLRSSIFSKYVTSPHPQQEVTSWNGLSHLLDPVCSFCEVNFAALLSRGIEADTLIGGLDLDAPRLRDQTNTSGVWNALSWPSSRRRAFVVAHGVSFRSMGHNPSPILYLDTRGSPRSIRVSLTWIC